MEILGGIEYISKIIDVLLRVIYVLVVLIEKFNRNKNKKI